MLKKRQLLLAGVFTLVFGALYLTQFSRVSKAAAPTDPSMLPLTISRTLRGQVTYITMGKVKPEAGVLVTAISRLFGRYYTKTDINGNYTLYIGNARDWFTVSAKDDLNSIYNPRFYYIYSDKDYNDLNFQVVPTF